MAKKLTQNPKRKAPFVTLIVAITLLIAWLGYNWFVHYQDRQKFMTLREDMLALQTEFNKIDPGWQYSESCHAKGEKFKESEASSCWVEISNNRDIQTSKYQLTIRSSQLDLSGDEYSFKNQGDVVNGVDGRHRSITGVACGLSSRVSQDSQTSTTVGCHDSALDFYFPRSQ